MYKEIKREKSITNHSELTMENELKEEILKQIPTNWLDSMLTGSGAVVGKPPYGCPEVEIILNTIRKRIETVLSSRANGREEKECEHKWGSSLGLGTYWCSECGSLKNYAGDIFPPSSRKD